MWMQAPDNLGGITVDRVSYVPEIIENGKIYFRAADHHVPMIVGTGLGFEVCLVPPETDLPDLPQADPLRDNAIADAQRDLAQLRNTVDQQKSELSAKNAEYTELLLMCDEIKLANHNLTAELANVTNDYNALREVCPPSILKKFDENLDKEPTQ